MSNIILDVNGKGIPIQKKSEYPDENMHIFSLNSMTNIHLHGGMNELMECLPFLAKYYELDKNKMLENWVKEVGIYKAMGVL